MVCGSMEYLERLLKIEVVKECKELHSYIIGGERIDGNAGLLVG